MESEDSSSSVSSSEEEEYVIKYIEENFSNFVGERVNQPKKRKRIRRNRVADFSRTRWALELEELENQREEADTSYQGRQFRRKFRVPYSVFKRIHKVCVDKEVFDQDDNCLIPSNLKLLACLRILGRDNIAHDISEMSGIGESTVNSIFKQFIKNFSLRCYKDYVYYSKEDSLNEDMQIYERLGFAGCIGSVDGTKVLWDRCSKRLTNFHRGKEKVTCVGFQCIVNHARRILHVSRKFSGNTNDITMANQDPVIRSMLDNDLATIESNLANNVFCLLDLDGQKTYYKGAYFITDSGYLERPGFINPSPVSFDKTCLMWCEWLESIRKDVECTFGILKGRFRFLKNRVRYRSSNVIEYSFKTCAIIHNILLEHDKLDRFDWDKIDPDGPEQQISNENNLLRQELPYVNELLAVDQNLSSPHPSANDVVVEWSALSYVQCKQKLIDHFTRLYHIQKLMWPRCFREDQRKRNAVKYKIMQRVTAQYAKGFYVAQSTVRTEEDGLGLGLFANALFYPDETLLYFEGRRRSWEEMEELENLKAPNKYYTVQITKKCFLDCYDNCKSNICLASYANSPTGAYYISNGNEAVANAKIVVSKQLKTAKLVALTTIKTGDEILVKYGQHFTFDASCAENMIGEQEEVN